MTDHRPRIAYLFGSDRQSGIVRRGGGHVVNDGSTDIWRLRSDAERFVRLHIPANFGRVVNKPRLDGIDVVLNLVTDPDQNPKVLDMARRFLRGFPGRIINHPEAVLATGRDRIHRLLAGVEGLVVPPIARFKGRPKLAEVAMARDGVALPAILRRPGTHNGDVVALVRDRADLEARLDPAATYLLTAFVDNRGDDGIHHKIRLYWFGDSPLIRHLLASDEWNVHGPARERVMPDHPRWMEEERRLIAGGLDALPAPARAAMVEIRQRMALDFFGVDFAVLPDGRALLFECNATMNFFPLSTDPRFAYAAAPVEAAARPLVDRMIGLEA